MIDRCRDDLALALASTEPDTLTLLGGVDLQNYPVNDRGLTTTCGRSRRALAAAVSRQQVGVVREHERRQVTS